MSQVPKEGYSVENSGITIDHVQGYKDNYKVQIKFPDGKKWSPSNNEIFALLDCWYKAEEAGFSNGYGKDMPLFYTFLIASGKIAEVKEALYLEGWEAKEFYESLVEEYAEFVEDEMRRIRNEASD